MNGQRAVIEGHKAEVLGAVDAAALSPDAVFVALDSGPQGLSPEEAAQRIGRFGINAVRQHRTGLIEVVLGQLKNPLLLLLLATAGLSFAVGDHTDAIIIGVILMASIGLGTSNEFRATRTAQALRADLHHRASIRRSTGAMEVDVTELVPGDLVHLTLGMVVPADIRLLHVDGLACDESVLTGEALPVTKNIELVAADSALADLTCCALMGTIVRTGSGDGIVVATGAHAELGRIAQGLQTREPQTTFQAGLTQFSVLLVQIAVTVSALVFVANVLLGRGIIGALLFSAAIAVGITPQLLPAVVSSSLASGSRQLARKKVLVKRLVAIEDLGDMDVLITDKTGTLTTGTFTLTDALGPDGAPSVAVARLALMATDVTIGPDGDQGDALDVALLRSFADPAQQLAGFTRTAALPFDSERRLTSALVNVAGHAPMVVTKGAPEAVLAVCSNVADRERALVMARMAAGGRVIAIASREARGLRTLTPSDERGLRFAGVLVFTDPPKVGASAAIARLASLRVRTVIATGDSIDAATRLAAAVGIQTAGALSGMQIARLSDQELGRRMLSVAVVARVTPEQKARIVRVMRAGGESIGFLGDGVNDALALHDADVGLCVDTATDVAREAADVVLLDKSLDVVADGVVEGRRIFANTIKYVLMGTSSNFGNILSAAVASAVLPFLPILASQLLLNNLLYDSGQLAIPTDHVDSDQLAKPGQWNIATIRRFMLLFGPLSSLFDFLTFAILLGPFHAGPELFRSGWFVESLISQTAVVFAIRTRRVPFIRSRPSRPLILSALAVIAIGVVIPLSPLAHPLGFVDPGVALYAVIAALAIIYLVLIDVAKKSIFDRVDETAPAPRTSHHHDRLARRISRFTVVSARPVRHLGASTPGRRA